MEFFTNLLESMDGNIIEYCILGGIVVLIVVLIVSIISCIKSLGNKDLKKKYAKLDIDYDEEETDDCDPVEELINIAITEKTEDSKISEVEVEPKEELKIAEKIEIPEIIEDVEETTVREETKAVVQKLDIKSITREMELRLEEETSEIDAYEDEQEKTAIISYKELLAAAAKIEANADKEEEYIDDVVFEFNSKKIAQEEQPKHAMKKFRPTIDISPVFGARKLETEQEDLLKIEEVSEEDHEIAEQRENFLKNLQDFRNNLD